MGNLAFVASDALVVCRAIRGAREVASLVDVERVLRAAPPTSAVSLDLYAHTTREHHHLRLGRDIVDVLDHRVAARFSALVGDGVLGRVVQIRLLGCSTAIGPAARASLVRLARLTRVAVVGTRCTLLAAHHDPDGLRPEFAGVLETFTPGTRNRPPWLTRAGPFRAPP